MSDLLGESRPLRVIFDTDMGTDVDDCLALAFLLGSLEVRLEAVTCVYGDVALRGRMTRQLLRLAGREDVPVSLGSAATLTGSREIFWAGHEGEGLLGSDDEGVGVVPEGEHAVDLLVRSVMAEPGAIHLLAVGPLTNVALALRREPRLASHLAGLTIMGGSIRGPWDGPLRPAEHNVLCDPEAASVVFTSGAPMRLVPLDVTTTVAIRADGVARLRAAGTPFHDAVADQVARYPRFAETGATFLHDPLAVALALRPDLAGWRDLHLGVETAGRLTTGMTVGRVPDDVYPATARVALEVDREAAERFVLNRISAPLATTGR